MGVRLNAVAFLASLPLARGGEKSFWKPMLMIHENEITRSTWVPEAAIMWGKEAISHESRTEVSLPFTHRGKNPDQPKLNVFQLYTDDKKKPWASSGPYSAWVRANQHPHFESIGKGVECHLYENFPGKNAHITSNVGDFVWHFDVMPPETVDIDEWFRQFREVNKDVLSESALYTCTTDRESPAGNCVTDSSSPKDPEKRYGTCHASPNSERKVYTDVNTRQEIQFINTNESRPAPMYHVHALKRKEKNTRDKMAKLRQDVKPLKIPFINLGILTHRVLTQNTFEYTHAFQEQFVFTPLPAEVIISTTKDTTSFAATPDERKTLDITGPDGKKPHAVTREDDKSWQSWNVVVS